MGVRKPREDPLLFQKKGSDYVARDPEILPGNRQVGGITPNTLYQGAEGGACAGVLGRRTAAVKEVQMVTMKLRR